MAVYIVQKNDSLSSIAKKLGISNWRTLYDQNKSVIGSNYNLIRPGQKLTYGSSATPSVAATPAVAPVGTGAAELVAGVTKDLPTNFADVLKWEQWFPKELAQGSAEQAYAQYYAPIAQQRQSDLESSMANRGLTRSGIRNQSLSDLYQELGTAHQKGIEADVLQQQAFAREDYDRMQQLYESSAGKQKPTQTQYSPYKIAKPVTDAGTYGSSYLDWLNKAIRV